MRHVRYGYFHSNYKMQVHCASNNGLGLVPLKGNEVVVAVTLVVVSQSLLSFASFTYRCFS